MTTLKELVSQFNTTPFLFVGSGISRRYYNLPDWRGLLREFAQRLSPDPFALEAYESRAGNRDDEMHLPRTASLIQEDFDKRWFSDPSIRRISEAEARAIHKGSSPFKLEVAHWIASHKTPNESYKLEIQKLRNISKQNLSGIITTNYDAFFETLFENYKVFVGQDELIFSSLQGIGEIYKIHGSVSRPDTLLINEKDYTVFNEKCKYLAAKLMTTFMEYPIIFLGYSLSDTNIRMILENIAVCLPKDKLQTLQKRFLFIKYEQDLQGYEISSAIFQLKNRAIGMTQVSLSDFSLLYDALAAKKAALPVRLLRMFKEELYSYVLTSRPGPLLQVADIDDMRITESDLAISIGKLNNPIFGLQSVVNIDNWYRDIVMNDLTDNGITSEQLLKYCYHNINKTGSNRIPVFKHLHNVTSGYDEILSLLPRCFDQLVSNTSKDNRRYTYKYNDCEHLWNAENSNVERACRLLLSLTEEKLIVTQLESILKTILSSEDCFSKMHNSHKSNVRSLIRYYDFLKWGNKKS